MANRIRFKKEVLEALPAPENGRSTYYDDQVQKLAVRVTSAGTKTFYVITRDGESVAWLKLGTFPDMTVEIARKESQKHLGDFARGASPVQARRVEKQRLTLGQSYERYRELYAKPRGLKTADDTFMIWQRCLGVMPDEPAKKHGRKRQKHPAGVDWSNRKLDEITPGEVRTLHAEIGTHTPVQANRVVEIIGTIYARAAEWGYTGINPAKDIRPFKEQKRDRFIQADELPAFFKALADDTSEDFKHFVLLCLLTGARRVNVLSAQWQEINLASAVWRIPDTKNGEPVVVALVPEALEILQSRDPQKSGFVFPTESKTGYLSPPAKRWQALLARAGMADFRIHDLRRSLGSWQAITGASLVVIGKSLGHKSADATMIYARLSMDPVRASVNTATAAMLEAAGVKKTAQVKRIADV
ncbi:site-specific integrase [Sulfuriferula sp.]|uniref:tyrosine-type recombinase/integrase n=1 Tax=Sulfuriferula sp. TaxID=2025307 RepID=UPI0027300D1C|nr:site-specific integrase [Sulfuriferula sp.]MDP2025869.1 site-specific integrase [Sulfuriferula sp.]